MVFRRAGLAPRAGRALLATLALGALLAAPAARGADRPGASGGPPRAYARGEVLVHFRGRPGERRVKVPAGIGVPVALARLRASPGVAYAHPDYLVRAAKACPGPNDPGRSGCWADDQWNFLPPSSVPGGVDALKAWHNLSGFPRRDRKRITVAVLDTGVAYRRKGPFRRDPDLPPSRRFVAPRDFVGGDRFPLDEDGHGTHVASTIAQSTNNGKGLTGLAHGVRVMPVRVLNRREKGRGSDVARGIRYATRHGADVLNLSLEFRPEVRRCGQITSVCAAMRRAIDRGLVIVAAAGNRVRPRVAFPAAAPGVIGVGATTRRSCLASYSDYGKGLDLVAPGGGRDRADPANPSCDPTARGFSIRQFSLRPGAAASGDFRRFGIVDMHGTSMAAAHVSAAAALLRAEGCAAGAVEPRLESTATDLGVPGTDPFYGAGLLNAGQATAGPC